MRVLADAAAVRAQPTNGKRVPEKPDVIVIDDDMSILIGMELLLSDWGYAPYCTATATKALEIIDRQQVRPRLILADYRLKGGKTGSDAIARIQERMGYRLPGVILTGDTAPDRIREAKASGHILLHKPLDPDELRRILGEILKG